MTRHRRPETPDADRPYAVGYRKPPKEHAFTKGDHANPSGRPKKNQSNGDIVQDLLSQTLKLRIEGKTVRITGRTALFRAQFVKAVNGDRNAAEFLLRHLDDPAKTLDMAKLEATDRAIVASYFERWKSGRDAAPRSITQRKRKNDDG